MSPAIEELRDRRKQAKKRLDRTADALRSKGLDLRELIKEIDAEQDEIDKLRGRRRELRDALEDEIKADENGKGKKPEEWEAWAENRRDELADLIDGSEGRINLLIEHVADTRERRAELRDKRKDLRKRVSIIERKITRKQDSSGLLTAHFHVAEFDCNDGTPVPRASIPALKHACVTYLEPARDAHGAIHVNSGFRHRVYNISVGGASMSIHVYDAPWQNDPFAVAIDHWADGASPATLQRWYASRPDGMGFYSSFTHVDNRNRIGWADSRWNGP
jgi:hypothetical protein